MAFLGDKLDTHVIFYNELVSKIMVINMHAQMPLF